MKTDSLVPMLVLGITTSFFAEPASAQNKLTPAQLEPSREIAADEKCQEYITGQFYFKICRDEEQTVTTTVDEPVDKRCVVYDPVKCCNVIVTKKVMQPRTITKKIIVPREIVFCKQVRIHLDDLEKALECPCADSEFLKVSKASAGTERANDKPAVAGSEKTTPAAANRLAKKITGDSNSESATDLVPIQWDSSSHAEQAPPQEREADSRSASRQQSAVAIRGTTNKSQPNHPFAAPTMRRSVQTSGGFVIQPPTTIIQQSVWPSIHTLPNVPQSRFTASRPR